MAKTNWQDPKTGEILSTHTSGLQEAVGKIEGSIGMKSDAEAGMLLSEVFISNDDRCRIYQAPEGKRNWLLSPTPIIKKNGAIITDDFEIDYGGGAVVFTIPILETDTLTADATHTVSIEGKQLSANDYTDEEKTKLGNIEELANRTILSDNISSDNSDVAASSKALKIVNDKVNKKVDKEEGQGLSSNDYTDEEKDKLANIASEADKTTADNIRNALGYVPVSDFDFNSFKNNIEGIGLSDVSGTFEILVDGEWIEIKGGGGGSAIELGNVMDLSIEAKLHGKMLIKWKDPVDIVLEGITLSKWGGTQLRRKLSTYPMDNKDGELVTDNKIRNQFENGYLDEGLVDGQKYYYALFPYTTTNTFTVDAANRISETAFEKYIQGKPDKPSVTGIGDLQAVVSSSVGSVVSLNQEDWHSSPHTFTGLTEDETYTPYAKFDGSEDYWESEITPGDSFIAINKLPQSPPPPPTISDLDFDKVTVTGVAGTEVKLDNGDWLDSPQTFTGLIAETEYEVFARMKETSAKFSSDSSVAKPFTTPSEIDPNSWQGIQAIVRRGLASEHFTVGDQIASNYDGGEMIWEVIGIDIDAPTDPELTHSITIQTKDCLEDRAFDSGSDNRYLNSPIREYLNSVFLSKLDPELSAVLGEVDKKVAKRGDLGGGQDSFSDKVFLLSRVEVDLGTEGATAGETVYPFYDGKGNANRIKNLNDSLRFWWLRSPYVSKSSFVRCVHTGGSLNSSHADSSLGLSPACSIV